MPEKDVESFDENMRVIQGTFDKWERLAFGSRFEKAIE